VSPKTKNTVIIIFIIRNMVKPGKMPRRLTLTGTVIRIY